MTINAYSAMLNQVLRKKTPMASREIIGAMSILLETAH